MDESKKDDVGTTGDGLGEGVSNQATHGSNGEDDNQTADSKGTLASGGGDEENLTQASGGSVD